MDTIKTIAERLKMIQQPDTVIGVAATSLPGIIYSIWVVIIAAPIEKWVSTATLIFIVLQIFFLIRDRFRKHLARAKKIEDIEIL